MIRVTVTPRTITVRGHAPLRWCAAVSTVVSMLRTAERVLVWHESPTERDNVYVVKRYCDDLDRSAVTMLSDLAIAGIEHIALSVRHDKKASRKRRRKKR